MSQPHALSDDQVTTELRKMTAFIRQEALEKAREIHLKADEEFSIEQSKLVRQETSRIDTEYAKKTKSAGMSQQITRSTLANKVRLRVLGAKQELLDGLFEDAGKGLREQGAKDAKAYEGVCKGLILEGLYALNEKKVTLRCRKKDDGVVKKAAEGARGDAGGLIILNTTGKIDINNTFDERLELLSVDALPSVRTTLFGENKNRKFKD
ncbi:V-ATPase V1 sector subunit E [Friedmanniomyces endolithicus]|nr:V-ATPase V1 sector subunit E [Friedmanniomyces endolithicus]